MSHSLEGAAAKFKDRLKEISTDKDNGVAPTPAELDQLFLEATCAPKYKEVIVEFESVLKKAYSRSDEFSDIVTSFDRFPLHEKRSLYVLLILFKNGIYNFDGEKAAYRSLIYNIAFLILFASIRSSKQVDFKPPPETPSRYGSILDNSAFRFLKLIVAGSVDGDRMDYTLRDGHACGSDIGRFDLSGITEHATLFRDKEDQCKLGFFHRSLPAIEQFFDQRHQSYKYLIYHRTSARSEACLQALILEVIDFCYRNPTDDIANYFQDLGYFSRSSDGIHKIFPIYLEAEVDRLAPNSDIEELPFLDDSNLRSFLQWTLRQVPKRIDGASPGDKARLSKIELLARIVLKREFQHIFDPFKSGGLRASIRDAVHQSLGSRGLPNVDIPNMQTRVQNLFARNRHYRRDTLKYFRNFVESRIPQDVIFISSEQEPKIYDHSLARKRDEELYIIFGKVDHEGYVDVKEISDVSIAMRRMETIFVDEFRMNYYFVGRNIKGDEGMNLNLRDVNIAAINRSVDMAIEELLNNEAPADV